MSAATFLAIEVAVAVVALLAAGWLGGERLTDMLGLTDPPDDDQPA